MKIDKNYFVCPDCDAVFKGDVCLNCGYIRELTPEEQAHEIEVTDEKVEEPKKTSIFADIGDGFSNVDEVIAGNKWIRSIIPVMLLFLFAGSLSFSYYTFVYSTTEFISPLVLSAQDIKNLEAQNGDSTDVSVTSLGDESEKMIDFNPELQEGNFKAREYAKFASPDIALAVEAFGLENYINRFIDEDLFKLIQDKAEISDDDLSVYYSDSFALILPNNNFDTWGLVLGVQDEEYTEEKLKKIQEVVQSNDYKKKEFPELFMDIVELKANADGDIKLDSEELLGFEVTKIESNEDESEDTNEESAKGQEKSEDDEKEDEATKTEEDNNSSEDSSDNQAQENVSDYYLIISNTKEFMDQMREASEGALPNLSVGIEYASLNNEIPTIGNVFVYRNLTNDYWPNFSDWIGSKFDYVGLNQILSDMKSPGLIFYMKDGKLRIQNVELK